MGFGLPVDFQAVDEYNKYQWRITGFHSSTYIKFTSIDAKLSANKKKSYNQYKEWAIPIGIAHFKSKQKYKSEFEKVSEWDTTIQDTMEEYDNVKR